MNQIFKITANYYHSVSNNIWDIQNLILDLSVFSVYGQGAVTAIYNRQIVIEWNFRPCWDWQNIL